MASKINMVFAISLISFIAIFYYIKTNNGQYSRYLTVDTDANINASAGLKWELMQQRDPKTGKIPIDIRTILKTATGEMGWQCMVLYSENNTLEEIGAPSLAFEESNAMFTGQSKGRRLMIARFTSILEAEQALAQWREFRVKQGHWNIVKEKRPESPLKADDALILVGDRYSGAQVYALSGQYLVVAGQIPDLNVSYDEIEQNRLLTVAAAIVG